MKTSVLYILLLISLFYGCDEREIPVVSDDIAYLSFSQDSKKDSTVLSFVAYPNGEIEANIVVEIRGRLLEEPREYTLSVNKERSTFPESSCVIAEKYVFPAGQTTDTIQVTFLNFDVNTEWEPLRLTLKIDESEKVKEGDKSYRNALYILSNRISRPKWWTVKNVGYGGNLTYNLAEISYLGLYSDDKYRMFLEELAKDGVEFDGEDVTVLRKYSLRIKYRIEEYNSTNDEVMWDEENSCPMSVPVRG